MFNKLITTDHNIFNLTLVKSPSEAIMIVQRDLNSETDDLLMVVVC